MIWAMLALIVILMALVAWGDLKLMLSFVALVALTAITLLAYDHWSDSRARVLVPPGEVELQDFRLNPLAGAVYELTGRVQNHASRFTLKRISVRITAQDCTTAEPAECVAIAEEQIWLQSEVPAGQARDIKKKLVFGRRRPEAKGTLSWQFDVMATQGD